MIDPQCCMATFFLIAINIHNFTLHKHNEYLVKLLIFKKNDIRVVDLVQAEDQIYKYIHLNL